MLREIAESILRAINEFKMLVRDSGQVTLRIGLVSVVLNALLIEELLFQEADKALFRAKSGGACTA